MKAKPIKVNLTREHVRRAEEAFSLMGMYGISSYCPVFQALKDAGVKVLCVGLATFTFTRRGKKKQAFLPKEAVNITSLHSSEWSDIRPTEFEVKL